MARTAERQPRRTNRIARQERRRAPRRNKLKLLTAYRSLDEGAGKQTGFARALDLSELGALLESPDSFSVGQLLSLEFLLDDNRIVQVEGHVTRQTKRNVFYRVGIQFSPVPAQNRRLLADQVAG